MQINNEKKCLFCEIFNLYKSKIIYESKNIFVINDINPQALIHMLFIPKKHINSFNEINNENLYIINDIFLLIKKIIKIKKLLNYKIINNNGVQAGQTIEHLHFHVISNKKLLI